MRIFGLVSLKTASPHRNTNGSDGVQNTTCRAQGKIENNNIETAIITDEDNVYYLCGYYDYLHMDFGRPTLLIISVDREILLVTPAIDLNTAQEALALIEYQLGMMGWEKSGERNYLKFYKNLVA